MTTATAALAGIDLNISDVSGQKNVRARSVPGHSTIGELVTSLLVKMGLARTDREGRPLSYRARLDREGRHLHGAELVGDALKADVVLVLQPNIDAGACGTGTRRDGV